MFKPPPPKFAMHSLILNVHQKQQVIRSFCRLY